ncbi:ribbon-helix-helix domain-containing protein [Cytobacillus firmus]|uniref:ribbon-helix-helix domain-containing protein n=1 Tax=Cytobacillus firmus TaxID=1399 RepID=UPI002187CB47|nr:ribbon-helix-helix domain-containing protein [Cytobacillus firmus]URM31603.1 ribbon-helix-helix domain-containing protein [Cytobacillus firmus]
MKTKLKNRQYFSSTLRNDLVSELDQLHKDTGIPKSKLLDQAVELLLKHHQRRIKGCY